MRIPVVNSRLNITFKSNLLLSLSDHQRLQHLNTGLYLLSTKIKDLANAEPSEVRLAAPGLS